MNEKSYTIRKILENPFTSIYYDFQTQSYMFSVMGYLVGEVRVQDWYKDIVDFQRTMGFVVGDKPAIPDIETELLSCKLVGEEISEFYDALSERDMPGIADAIADAIVVLLGTAVSYGIDMRPIWDEVHRTNMAKVGGEKREDGKHLKPEGWVPPDIKGILRSQDWNECKEE